MDASPFGRDLALQETQDGNVLIVHVEEEELTADNAMHFQAHLVHRITAGYKRIILDLSQVQAIDQHGIDGMRAGLHAVGGEGDLVLCSITEPVMDTLRSTLMNRVFGIFVSTDEAKAALT